MNPELKIDESERTGQMTTSPLLEEFRTRELATGEYCGAISALRWPDEAASCDGARVYDGSFRDAVRVSGPEARKWLNGMISANVRDLAPGRHAPSFQLDPKGHPLAFFDVACEGQDEFFLLASRDQMPSLLERLRKYVFISKLTLHDLGVDWTALMVQGAVDDPVWGRLPGGALEPGRSATAGLPEGVALALAFALGTPGSGGSMRRLELWAPRSEAGALWARLTALAPPAGSERFERERILAGVPRYGVDMGPGELAQETGQLQALDFTKGCYIGQEIVERIRARGAVHRRWSRMSFEAPVAAGASVEVNGQDVGRLTSVASAPTGWIGLGYLRHPHDEIGAAVRSCGADGRVLG